MSLQNVGIEKISRRDFMKKGLIFGAGARGLAAGYAAVPDVFAKAVYAAKGAGVQNDKVLVMIQLGGGNDGLQTVIPVSDGKYRDLRPTLGKEADAALRIDKDWGLHQSLKGIKNLYDQGKVAVVQGVGYPAPSFSHFDSIRVWETGDPTRRQQNGWLGKTIEKNYDSAGHPLVGCATGTTSTPGALRDLQATLTVINDQTSFKFQGNSGDVHRPRHGRAAEDLGEELRAEGQLLGQPEARVQLEESAGRRAAARVRAHRDRHRREGAARDPRRLRHPLHRAQPPQ